MNLIRLGEYTLDFKRVVQYWIQPNTSEIGKLTYPHCPHILNIQFTNDSNIHNYYLTDNAMRRFNQYVFNNFGIFNTSEEDNYVC